MSNNSEIEHCESQKQQDDGEFLAAPEGIGGSATGAAIAGIGDVVKRVGHYRWMICALLFFASAINYVDRQVIAILKPTLTAEFGWTEIDYGWIVFAFQTAYAIGLLFVGRFMDRFGTKIGFAVSITVWSLAAMLHAWAVGVGEIALPIITPIINGVLAAVNTIITPLGFAPWSIVLSVSVAGFMVVRFVLGLGEAGNFPGVDQDDRRVVPEERTCSRDRYLQFRNQRRSSRNAARRSDHRLVLGLVRGIYHHRCDRLHLARFLAVSSTNVPKNIRGFRQKNLHTSKAIRSSQSTKIPWKRLFRIARRGHLRSANF